MLLWSEQFSTGHKTIDEQHRMLFEKINRLEGLLTETNPSPQECDFIVGLANFLESYAVEHFQLEEQCMERYRCPAYQQNKDAHQQFILSFRQLNERYRSGGFRQEVLKQLHDFAESWIQQHIMRIDVQLKPCLRQIETGLT